jgi:hypothetical protein
MDDVLHQVDDTNKPDSTTDSTQESKPRSHIQTLLCSIAIASGYIICVPWWPMHKTRHLEYTIHQAFAENWQHGIDIAMTYGPWGFLGLRYYHPDTYLIMVVANCAYLALYIIMMRDAWKSLHGMSLAFPFVLFAVLHVPNLLCSHEWGYMLQLPYGLLLLYIILMALPEYKYPRALEWTLIIAMGPLVYIKGTFSLLVIITVGFGYLVTSTPRKYWWHMPVFLASCGLFYLLGGQHVSSFPAFTRGLFEIIRGYKATMGSWNASTTVAAMAFVPAAATVVAALLLVLQSRLEKRYNILVALYAAGLSYIIYQHGFVRATYVSGAHLLQAHCTLWIMIGTVVLPAALRLEGRRMKLAGALAIPSILAALYVFVVAKPSVITEKAMGCLQRRYIQKVIDIVGFQTLDEQRTRRFKQLADQYPLIQTDSTWDALSCDSGIIMASQQRYRPRPTLVSYSAYTPYLVALNERYLTGPNAPERLLLAPPAIDHNYPTMADAALFRVLATHYVVDGHLDKLLTLSRRGTPRQFKLTPIREEKAQLNEIISVPAHEGDILWVDIHVRRNLYGKLISTSLKPLPMYIAVDLGSRQVARRFVPELAKNGFLLSPYCDSLETFTMLYGDSPRPQINEPVKTMMLQQLDRGLLTRTRGYHETYTVTFYRLQID